MEWEKYQLLATLLSIMAVYGLWMEVLKMRREVRDLLTEIRDSLKEK